MEDTGTASPSDITASPKRSPEVPGLNGLLEVGEPVRAPGIEPLSVVLSNGIERKQSQPVSVINPDDIKLISQFLYSDDRPGDELHLDMHGEPNGWEGNFTAKWIKKNIRMRVCNRFSPTETLKNVTGNETCKCGRSLNRHSPGALMNYAVDMGKWDPEKHIISYPTTGYGEIQFGNNQRAKFIRVCSTTDMEKMVILLKKQWELPDPKLLVSVTGGATSFNLNNRLKRAFQNGLAKTTQSIEGAWIVSGGTNVGVMKYVGEAVCMNPDPENKQVVLGIATWGKLQNKESLSSMWGKWPAFYTPKHEEKAKKLIPLDPNHNVFILVDVGMEMKSGLEIEFRGKLEDTIRKMKSGIHTNVPAVCVVVQGGFGTVETFWGAVMHGTPVVVLNGSGGAADVLAFAYNVVEETLVETTAEDGTKTKRLVPHISDVNRTAIEEKIRSEFRKLSKEKFAAALKMVIDCAFQRHLVEVFSLDDSGDDTQDMDVAMLHAIMKANNDRIRQLDLALAWNRIDIARQEIFTDDYQWNLKDLEEILHSALIQNKAPFVDLILSTVNDISEYLTVDRLKDLYNKVPYSDLLHHLLGQISNRDTYTLGDVGSLIKAQIGDFYQPLYHRYPEYKEDPNSIFASLSVTTTKFPEKANKTSRVGPFIHSPRGQLPMESGVMATVSTVRRKMFESPSRELFIWAVLMRREELAMLFLNDEKLALGPALVANSLLVKMKESAVDNVEEMKVIERLSMKFQDMAVGILSECYMSSELRAREILLRVMDSYGQVTPFQLAVHSENKEFVSHQCCQSLLTSIWWGNLDQGRMSVGTRTWWKVPVSLACPPLIPFTVDLNENTVSTVKKNLNPTDTGPKDDVLESYNSANAPGAGTWTMAANRFYGFYNAPVIKYVLKSLFYLMFLTFFAYIMLVDYHPENSTFGWSALDWLLLITMSTILAEEIRQLASDTDSEKWRTKIQLYFLDIWNCFDFLLLFFYFLGVILRLSACLECASYSRTMLAVSLMIACIRSLRQYTIFRSFGPLIVMIINMLQDLARFGVILFVVICAYAIGVHAIMYPNMPLDRQLLLNIFDRAYWQMYGELFLEEIEGDNGCTDVEALWRNRTMPRCASDNVFTVKLILGLYILITQILLFNLLIAMFSYTFQKVQEKTDVHWMFERYFVVSEYSQGPILPPPLTAFNHIWLIIKACLKCANKTPSEDDPFKRKFSYAEDKSLAFWERIKFDDYLLKQKTETMNSDSSRIEDIQKRLLAASFQNESRFSAVDTMITAQSQAIANILQHLGVLQASGVKGPGTPVHNHPVPVKLKREVTVLQDDSLEVELAAEKNLHDRVVASKGSHFFVHTASRATPYYKSGLARYPVSDFKVVWEIDLPGYRPVEYTSDNVLQSSLGEKADPKLLEQGSNVQDLSFNGIDTLRDVDRRSLCGPYSLSGDGYPLNPYGRTGLAKRGALERWGPNKFRAVLIVYMSGDDDDDPVFFTHELVNDIPKLPVTSSSDLAIDPLDIFIERLQREACDEINTRSIHTQIYSGYADDSRNTDNSWSEAIIDLYMDSSDYLALMFPPENGSTMWASISTSAKVFPGAGDRFILSKASEYLERRRKSSDS